MQEQEDHVHTTHCLHTWLLFFLLVWSKPEFDQGRKMRFLTLAHHAPANVHVLEARVSNEQRRMMRREGQMLRGEAHFVIDSRMKALADVKLA
jgi:hypothetical protein